MMKKEKLLNLLFVLVLVLALIISLPTQLRAEKPEGEEPVLVGRISHIEGQVMRYVPEEKDWVATVKDAPFGINDALYSEKGSRAEIIMPNNTWVRIGGDAQIQLILLKEDLTEIDIASSVARFYNKSSQAVIKATTPFGYVMAPAKTCFDLYVGDESVEVVALVGTVYFIPAGEEGKYEVIAGSSSILADNQHVTTGQGHVDILWDEWNQQRDSLWADRLKAGGKSARYLPPWLYDDAYVFEEHGVWERVYYDGAYRYFWRPVYVNIGWTPFTVGRWTVWYGDHTWIPYEPFGYVTHHFGHWVFVDDYWYWAPPFVRARVHVGPPPLHVKFAWYPGRVAWVHFGVYLGWFPLAPGEPYYCHRRWGPHAIVTKNINLIHINIQAHKYRNFRHANIIRHHNFYNAENYEKVRIRGTNHPRILKSCRVAQVVDHRVIRNHGKTKKRYHFTNVRLSRKPHRTAIARIQHNRFLATQSAKLKGQEIRWKVDAIGHGRLGRGVRVKPPTAKHRTAPVNQAYQSASKTKTDNRNFRNKAKLQPTNPKLINRAPRGTAKERLVKASRQPRVRWKDQRLAKDKSREEPKMMVPSPVSNKTMGQKEDLGRINNLGRVGRGLKPEQSATLRGGIERKYSKSEDKRGIQKGIRESFKRRSGNPLSQHRVQPGFQIPTRPDVKGSQGRRLPRHEKKVRRGQIQEPTGAVRQLRRNLGSGIDRNEGKFLKNAKRWNTWSPSRKNSASTVLQPRFGGAKSRIRGLPSLQK